MSTITAIGPALGIDGPLPRPPEYRLLSIPGVLREDGGRWMNGVNVWGYPEDVPSLWEPCSAGTYRTKDSDSDWSQPRFDPFVVYVPIECSTISVPPEEFARRAEIVLDATISHAVEQALSQGVPGATSPFFGDVNVNILSGAAVTPEVGLRYLEDAIGATGRMGLIHATPSVVAAWEFEALETNAYLRTPNGTPVASGSGYIGATPAGGVAAGDGQSWVYATGPVAVYLADADPPRPIEFIDQSDNTMTYRAERYALAFWDTALQAAILVDWTP